MNVPESHTHHCSAKARAEYGVARMALHKLMDCFETACASSVELLRMRRMADTLERYCELRLAANELAFAREQPSQPNALTRLSALQHLAGRHDAADLMCAARCLSRTGERKLQSHVERARALLMRDCIQLQRAIAETPYEHPLHTPHRLQQNASRLIACEALLGFLVHVAGLASHLEDRFFATEISRLLNLQCGYLRRLTLCDESSSCTTDSRDFSQHALKRAAHV